MAIMWKIEDTSALDTLIVSVAGFGTIVLTAVVNKNKAENINKFSQDIDYSEDRYEEERSNGN